jgi:SAM-dependent methyltransferase
MTLPTSTATELKTCCAALYETDYARLLLGDSFHPGGLELTERLGEQLELRPGQRVLDVASGTGATAVFLAERFGCHVVGLDYSTALVRQARRRAQDAGLEQLVRFEHGDSERLPFPDGAFDALICECSFCTFPDKHAAADEFARVLRAGGHVGLTEAGFRIDRVEPHPEVLEVTVRDVRAKLLGAELLLKATKVEIPGVDIGQAKSVARTAAQTIEEGTLGYGLLVGTLP